MYLWVLYSCQDTIVCTSEANTQSIYINTQCQRKVLAYTLITKIPEDTQRWMEALCHHVYNMSESSQQTYHTRGGHNRRTPGQYNPLKYNDDVCTVSVHRSALKKAFKLSSIPVCQTLTP